MRQSLAYFYTRTLIHRPLLCHGSGSAASAAGIVLAAAGKHILQIVDLLLERRMNYTFPLNKADLLVISGISVLWQSTDLDDDSKLVKDNQKSLTLSVTMLNNENPAAAIEFQKMAASLIALEGRPGSPPKSVEPDNRVQRPNTAMAAPAETKTKSTRKQLQALASRWSTFGTKAKSEEATRTVSGTQNGGPTLSPAHRAASTVSLASTRSAPVLPMNTASPNHLTTCTTIDTAAINLDYLPLGDEFGDSQTRTSSSTMLPPKKQQTPASIVADASWDQLLTNFDNNSTLYADMTAIGHPLYQPTSNEWTPDAWQLSGIDLTAKAPVPQSLLSFSEESLTSGDDFMFSTAGSHNGSTVTGDNLDPAETYRGITIPVDDEFDFHEIGA